MIDALLADAQATGTPIDGVDGLLNKMTKAVIERALQAEMTQAAAPDRRDDLVAVCPGMTTRDIEAHLREVYGVNASRELISNVTDEIELWRNRPLMRCTRSSMRVMQNLSYY